MNTRPNTPLAALGLAVLLLMLFLTGCEEKQAPQPVYDPRQAAFLAEGRANAARDHLVPSMSDEQILRAIGHDPTSLASHLENGVDGYSMTYTNATTDVCITRSIITGICVLRFRPKEQKAHWLINKQLTPTPHTDHLNHG